MSPRSEKTKKLYADKRVPLVKKLLAERPFCEACEIWAEYDGKVTCRRRRSEDPHEIKSRGRGGSIIDEENILMVCRTCHNRITAEPTDAKKLGLLDNSWDEDRGPQEPPREIPEDRNQAEDRDRPLAG